MARIEYARVLPKPPPTLFRQVLIIAMPVMAEQVLHMLVGLTDTYLANHLPDPAFNAPAAAAVGTIAYVLWFVGLIVGAVGTGSTAIIARAIGARHRSLANKVTGQSVSTAILAGIVLGAILWFGAMPIVRATQLSADAQGFALSYIRILSLSLPFAMFMFIANACLRGSGDTLTPAKVMIVVDAVNIGASFALAYGWGPIPALGFPGIAWGTSLAYVVGGLIQAFVLIRPDGRIRLHLHRMPPHWHTLKRILRIGVPSGLEGALTWLAQFGVVIIINRIDPTNTQPAAHINTIRIESISFLSGFAFATAAATLVGQSLGAKDPQRATRAAYLAYAAGGTLMTLCGLVFVFFPHLLANVLASSPEIAEYTARCLQITGTIQFAFAGAMIFSGALRGAGDTKSVMVLNLLSIILLRFGGVVLVAMVFHRTLIAIWVVLCIELLIRGILMYWRFAQGQWRHVEV
jgi:MATE family multidrug resistance protein